MNQKVDWSGVIVSVQPRIRLIRSYDERSHGDLGYVLRVRGVRDGEPREFVLAVGKALHAKHDFRVGDQVSGLGEPVEDERLATADLHKVSRVKLVARGKAIDAQPPPFMGLAPPLEVYRQRGHRRLAAKTYSTKCGSCMWGCEMVVELIVDPWNRSRKKYRRETFCYGPKSCAFYAAGPTRKVPGRSGSSFEEDDWIDDEATSHRGPDD